MSDMIDKQNVIDLISWAIEDDWDREYAIARINEMPVANKYVRCKDAVSRQQVIDTIMGEPSETYYPCYFAEMIRKLPAAQHELTDEQSIAHLQSSGWMQRHDKEMYESGLKEQLADDSDSYDSLLPTVHPEVIRCVECEHWKNEHLCESLSRFGSFETKADFYCGYAERKINERTG